MNECPDHYLLNDLYVLQDVDSTESWEGFSQYEDAVAIKKLLSDMVRHRSAVHSPKGIANSAEMTPEQLQTAESKMADLWPADGTGDPAEQKWNDVVESVISTAAQTVGKSAWGWNTPQDYHHAEKIIQAWPNARFVFMLRDPRTMLKSYKFYPKRPAADRYHPLAQSMAWRNAARAFLKLEAKYPEHFMLVRYEDIVAETRREIERLNAFLPASIPEDLNLESLGNNSSYARKDQAPVKRELTPLELWISDRILYRERVKLGFEAAKNPFSLSGVFNLLKTTWRFSKHYGKLVMFDANIRRRVGHLLKAS
ncbi:hypothetical protein ACMU_18010 [Actibacterium mucosum KCTC 23349]|uniref:Sulfotransferase domain-containing protein n=1 Tax=Actibacterium mucosum KCTC 23349 TaxID=1454373 RepID=A0A037ZGE0_9RHOB|nr:hypothetical protein ACMU_18010 [Actibacterium mucosum KCTC 23349]